VTREELAEALMRELGGTSGPVRRLTHWFATNAHGLSLRARAARVRRDQSNIFPDTCFGEQVKVKHIQEAVAGPLSQVGRGDQRHPRLRYAIHPAASEFAEYR
jgi:hypothetical protein